MSKRNLYLGLAFILILLQSCGIKPTGEMGATTKRPHTVKPTDGGLTSHRYAFVEKKVRIGDYFAFMDSLVAVYDTLVSYKLSEHILVRANPWIIDTLANTDYYRMMARDSFVYDQKELIVLRAFDSLIVPDSLEASKILNDMQSTWIDINIPEFKLRIYRDSVLLYTFPIRVGQNRKRQEP